MIKLMICVNDPDNGCDTGRVDGIDLYVSGIENAMELRGQSLVCRTGPDEMREPQTLRIGHIVMPVHGYQNWVGNWCWDAALVTLKDAARVVNYVRRHGWNCEGGYTELYDAFDAGKDISEADLERALSEDV